ncbi:EamA family transporter [Frondihabitans australicus]|uniref:Inner membrane transporter RhtA n=1 Tax=Frondihabitans australicus TaxID=386892 RepID=A0A495ICP9_9MICO|nr:EamA family transporter [Frondihabitans australicus]RKR73784.1 inner membrane transporter RhtA [Frondihabitans australicus]
MGSVPRVPAPLLAVAAIFSVQFGSAFARLHFDEVGPTGAATLRLVFGAVILVVAVRPRVGRWRLRQWVAAILLGLALAGMNSLIYLALARIPLGVAVTLEFTGPLAVALAQTRRWRDAGWALLAFVGVVLLGVGSTGSIALGGVLLAFGAAAFWAGYIFASSHAGRLIDGIDGLVVAVVVAAIVVSPFGAGRAWHAVVQEPTLVAVFLAVALLTSALPYALEMVALRRIETRVFGVLSSLGPAVAALAGLVVVHQALDAREIVALVLVTAASVGVTVTRRSTGSAMSHDVSLG